MPFLFPLLGLLLPFALDGLTTCGPEVSVPVEKLVSAEHEPDGEKDADAGAACAAGQGSTQPLSTATASLRGDILRKGGANVRGGDVLSPNEAHIVDLRVLGDSSSESGGE